MSFGGIWGRRPSNPVVYPDLRTNIPTAVMQSFDLEFPSHLPSYITAAEYGDYMEQYAAHFGLNKKARFGVEVTSIRRTIDEDAASTWRVSWRDASSGQKDERTHEDYFDGVVVATGHYNAPYWSEVPGQSEWLEQGKEEKDAAAGGGRTVMHAQKYRGPAAYAGRSVLVVGGRSSAVDIARELRDVCSWLYVLEKGCEQVLTVGNSTHLPLGAELLPSGHITAHGSTLEFPPVQDVILATGYIYDYPFLDAQNVGLEYGPNKRSVLPLYQHIVDANCPSLCFVGIPLAISCPIPLFEAQARFIATHLLGDAEGRVDRGAEQHEKRLSWVAQRSREAGDRPQDLHFLSQGTFDYMEELVRGAGLASAELQEYLRRLALVKEVYLDRCSRRQVLPWDEATYRDVNYNVSWSTGRWTVTPP
eukprot:TRINITY_DN26174_c0_g3_i1.p1 TRINITY_DN26174_c0_g3~~TRINITY_DN26174_c0_g3_i1.p1  ORF type:complete len:478 (-),score=74.48 TRINITY_DN26174_c0_g3_i1:87-1343(-)